MSSRTFSRRSRIAAGLVAAASIGSLALPMLAASADTTVANVVTTATTPTQSGVIAPGGTLTGLNNGDPITLTVTASSPATVGGFEVRQCRGAATNIINDFGFDPTANPNCLDAAFNATSQEFGLAVANATSTIATVNFLVGTGTRTNVSGGGGTITCNAANPCTLWLRESVNSGAVTQAWIHYNLQFAAAPAAPVAPAAPTASLAGTTANLSWVAPVGSNPAITSYTVTPYLGAVAQAPIVTGTTATTLAVPALANFGSYTFTVKATNAIGSSPESAPSAPPVVPSPTATTGVTAVSTVSSTATVSWTAPSFTTGLSGYVVTSNPGAIVTTVGNVLTANVSGLTDGTTYTFTVHALYGANSGQESAPSAPVSVGVPTASVNQIVWASRPAGTLDIAEACSNNYAGQALPAGVTRTGGNTGTTPTSPLFPKVGTAYPNNPGVAGGANPTLNDTVANPNFGLYPQTCDVDLGTGVLNAASTHYVATGAINTVSVRDTRSGNTSWHVNTSFAGNFSNGSGGSFSKGCLAGTPAFTERSGSSTYAQNSGYGSGAGTAADPAPVLANTTGARPTAVGGDCAGTGLDAQTVMNARGLSTAVGGLGRTDLDMPLTLNIPVEAPAGTYSANMVFTVLGN